MVQNYNLTEDTVPRAKCSPGDEIVISGFAGRFPNSHNTKEFEDNLYNKVDMCDDDERRWRHEFPEIPKRSGKTYDLDKFDSTFFRINEKQANALDPQMRVIMEHAYESIIDAGICPYSLRGSKTGVFIGSVFTESEIVVKESTNQNITASEYSLTGLGRSMFANRLSYSLDLQGPSCLVDAGSTSALYVLNLAYNAIRSGECDAAIIGASNCTLHPYITLNYDRLGVLAKDGVARPFDDDASGYVRAEAFGCLFLQKAKDAKRIYSTVVYSKTNSSGVKPDRITYPSGALQTKIWEEFYREIDLNPDNVAFVEAHSTGTKIGDAEECMAIDRVFCKNRNKPLPIGSVKSNMGNAESAAGICSLAKCIFALEKNLIPPNINFKTYRSGIESFEKNRLQVVTEPQKLEYPLIAINSFGLGGTNAHCLLRGNSKNKINDGRPLDKLPRLVNWAGRTEEACQTIFDGISSRRLDEEFIGLIHNTQQYSTSGNVYRSFGIFRDEENENAKCLARDVQHFPGIKPKVVFVFSGMGSQWCEMGTALLQIPLFRKSIEKCHNILLTKGLDLFKILTSNDKTTFDNVIHSFVGIAAIQIGICDILDEICVKPDIIVGHSVGELGCAYADGCLTAEEMILCAYSRGLATIETDTIYGAMAAVGLGYEQIKSLLPDSIDVACHNSAISSTISGPKEDVEKFVAELKTKNIFAKEVPAANRAFHSRYISEMGPKLQAHLKQIITCPKERSKKWLSSSVPEVKWVLPESQLCSAEYQTNNLLSPVLFEEVIAQLPKNAVTIEIAPHGLLQAILKKSLTTCSNIPLTQRDNPENHIYFLSALGKLFQTGIDMSINKLYPKIEFPVSRGTPRLSDLIKWNHKESYYVMNFNSISEHNGDKLVSIQAEDSTYAYIVDNVINGKAVFPSIGYLQLVWEAFAELNGKTYTDIDVEFEDVQFLKTSTLQSNSKITFAVLVNQVTGHFDVNEGSVSVVTGYIREVSGEEEIHMVSIPTGLNTISLSSKEFYKELRVRGYHYGSSFKNILEARSDGITGKVKWDNNWVTFIDSILQIYLLQMDTRSLMLPSSIQKLTIKSRQHFKFQLHQAVDNQCEIEYFEIRSNKHLDLLQCGGIEIKGLEMLPISQKFKSGDPIVEIYKFITYLPAPRMSLKNAIRTCAQYVIENTNKRIITCVELFESGEFQPLSDEIKKGFENNPQVVADITILTSKDIKTEIPVKNETLCQHKNYVVAIATNYSFDSKLAKSVSQQNFEYIILRETNFNKNKFIQPKNYNLIYIVPIDEKGQTIVMLQRISTAMNSKSPTVVKITAHNKKFDWLEQLRKAVQAGPTILYSQGENTSGIMGLVNCIRRELPKQNIRYFFIDDVNAPPFKIDSPFYQSQINLNMVANVYRNGKWGNYRHLLMETTLKEVAATDHIIANITKLGDLSSFEWNRGSLNIAATKSKLIRIQYSALNVRDITIASGKGGLEGYPDDRLQQTVPLGVEFAGVTENGDRVMGLNMAGTLSSHISISDGCLIWKCPDNWTLADAATIPFVYSTVYIALLLRANIQKGKSILIHSGAGSVGLAAIRVCLGYGLTVFTTVGTLEKREYLLKCFPQLKLNQIGNSRDRSFEKMIKVETNGNGVDFVLNSLTGNKLTTSIECLAAKGKFLEIGKYDLINNSKIGLREFLKEISFHSVLLDNITESNRRELETVKILIERDIKQGIIQPLPTTIYPANDLQAAFQYLATGNYIGKVLIKIRENSNDNVTLPVQLKPRFVCDPQSSYIGLGGLGGFGLELVDWLIMRGARQLVLSSRQGISNSYQQYRLNLWKSYGVRITITTSDIATRKGCTEIIEEAHRLGPVTAIFNLATILENNVFQTQTSIQFNNAFGPKSYATEHFDQLSRALCPRLQHFVVFSSIATGRGDIRQTSYGMANSIMERIMEQRHADNLPGIAIQWGPIADVGMLADLLQDNMKQNINGTIAQGIASCLEELNSLLFSESPIVASMIVAEKIGKNFHRSSSLFSDLGDISMANENILQLNTHDNPTSNSHSAVIMIPGIESIVNQQLRNISTLIEHPVFCLQLWNIKSVDEIANTISKLAENLIFRLGKKVKQVYIVGYTFGSIASLHLAAELEKFNIKTHVLLIDGSPEYLKKWGSSIDDDSIESSVLTATYKILSNNNNNPEFIQNSMLGSTFVDRLHKLLELVGPELQTKYPVNYIKQLAENLYSRIQSLSELNLDSVPVIRSTISLGRFKNIEDTDEMYGLKSYTTADTVEVKEFDEDNGNILERIDLVEWLLEYFH